jgi:hypothetical protein
MVLNIGLWLFLAFFWLLRARKKPENSQAGYKKAGMAFHFLHRFGDWQGVGDICLGLRLSSIRCFVTDRDNYYLGVLRFTYTHC